MKNQKNNEIAKRFEDSLKLSKPVAQTLDPYKILITHSERVNPKVVTFINTAPKARLIFRILKRAFNEVRVNFENYNKSLPISLVNAYLNFIPWLNDHKPKNTYSIFVVKEFEAYMVNERKLKPQSVGGSRILQALKIGMNISEDLTNDQRLFLSNIISRTKFSLHEKEVQLTLTNWFEKLPWIRHHLDNDVYNRIASPKRLVRSFSLSTGASLLKIQALIRELEKFCIDHCVTFEDIEVDGSNSDGPYTEAKRKKKIVDFFCIKNGAHLSDDLKITILHDLLHPRILSEYPNILKLKISPYSTHCLDIFQGDPCIFNYAFITKTVERSINYRIENINSPRGNTLIEQRLFRFLMAWLTVQTFDIPKLTKSNWRFLPNEKNPKSFYLSYYKGRSGTFHETRMLSSNQVEGRAILKYLQNSETEFNEITLIPDSASLNTVLSNNSSANRHFKFLSTPSILKSVLSYLKIKKASRVYPMVIKTILENIDQSPKQWMFSQSLLGRNCNHQDYLNEYPYAHPTNWFGLASIKNSSIHAESDRLRDGHLVNTNSHSSITELEFYLSGQNQEWLNSRGRLTRIIINDLANTVFRPSLDYLCHELEERRLDLKIRTKIIAGVDGEINDISHESIDDEEDFYKEFEPDTLIVIESAETVVEFMHYISESEKIYTQLLEFNPLYLERTLLPTVEWMENILATEFNKSTLRIGRDMYKKISKFLPRKFTNQVRG